MDHQQNFQPPNPRIEKIASGMLDRLDLKNEQKQAYFQLMWFIKVIQAVLKALILKTVQI